MEIIKKIKEDKLMSSLFILIIFLGLFLRFNDFSETPFWNDDLSTVPSGILWFYPHSYFPGLSGNSEPPLGNMAIGLGCITSKEDFSGVSQIQPGFYPGRPALIGKPMINSELNCHIPVLIFGLLFFIAVILLALTMFDKYSALYIISFYSFFPEILRYSRWIHVDMLQWAFITFGLLFLYKAFIEEKYSKKETIFFILSFSSFALALATKLTSAPFFVFGAFILCMKYKDELNSLAKKAFYLVSKEKLREDLNENIKKEKRFMIISVSSIILSLFLLLLPFKLSPKNFFEMYKLIRTVHNPYNNGISFHNPITQISIFLSNFNIFDVILFFLSLFILYKLIMKKRDSQENFILYLIVFYLISVLLFNALELYRLTVPFFFGIIFLISLLFSEKDYSLINFIGKSKKRIIFIVLILTYSSFSFYIAFAGSPSFLQENPLECTFNKGCPNKGEALQLYSTKIIADELNNLLEENETFFPGSGVLYYYIRQEDDSQIFLFETDFRRQTGKSPGIADYLTYYRPNGRFPRYLILNPYSNEKFGEQERLIKERIEPTLIVKNKDKDIVYIYDVLKFIVVQNER